MLLQKGAKSLPALAALRQKIDALNHGNLLPPGMHISTIYDRTKLIDMTTETVRHVVIMGLTLVTLVLLSMLGDWRITLIAAVTIPFAVLFAFSLMVLTNQSANLISIGAIDFGILVDASIVVLESVYRRISRRVEGEEIGRVDPCRASPTRPSLSFLRRSSSLSPLSRCSPCRACRARSSRPCPSLTALR